MKQRKKETLGDTRQFGPQRQVLTDRGWVVVDDEKEMEEEMNSMRARGLLGVDHGC